VGPRDRIDAMKGKISPLPGLELRSLGRPARSQSLHRLRYPGSSHNILLLLLLRLFLLR
jgi:hypothetical protein